MNLAFRVGQGLDVHRLVEGRRLVLGGVDIPYEKGLLGHSDADALLHAITDAILGAAGLGDIGRLFPDTDARFHNADSRALLREAYARVAAMGWRVVNVDASIIAQAPKISPYAAKMVANIAQDLDVAVDAVNVKGKTNERLGHLGRGEGIATQAVVLLQRGGM
ncbi:MAG: 2-C-methyl-D-erythritol 2,4-cyclodiphosphate synthase [Uliginosibacterium sp.]|nr:2-C-methyl-D-erythritol 2,4-cyclodiphosphate synthase [Uliginosibacterium sp.]